MGVFRRVIKKVTKKVRKPISKITKGIARGIAKVGKAVMKGVAKLNKKMGPLGMIAMSIAMPYALQGLGGMTNSLMMRPEGTFLRAIGEFGNNIRVGFQGFKTGLSNKISNITGSIREGFSSFGKGNNIFTKISDGAKKLYTKAKELTPKFRTGKTGTVKVEGWGHPISGQGSTMTSEQAYALYDKGMIKASQLSNQTIGESAGWITKGTEASDNLISKVINEAAKDNISLLDKNGLRHFDDLVRTAKQAGTYVNDQEIFTHMINNNGTTANYLTDFSISPDSYTTNLLKSGDYREGVQGGYIFEGNKTFSTNTLEPNKFTKAIKDNKKAIISSAKNSLFKKNEIIEPEKFDQIITGSAESNDGSIKPLTSSASVQGSAATDFFKKVYGDEAWQKLKSVSNHMGYTGDNMYITGL